MVTYGVAKPAWTPTMPFLSVFPGISSDTDLIENENLHRKSRRNRWLRSSLSTKIEESINEANKHGKHADATRQLKVETANEQTSPRQNTRKWQNSRKMSAIYRREKRAAQQDFVARLSCVKQTVPQRIYYPKGRLSPTSPINSPSATTTRRVGRHSLDMVCGAYLNILCAIYW